MGAYLENVGSQFDSLSDDRLSKSGCGVVMHLHGCEAVGTLSRRETSKG
jgi:hypothetical protein